MLHAGVARQVQDELAVLLERLFREDLGEEVRRVGLARNVLQRDTPSATQLTHLEQLAICTIDVTR